MTKKKAAQPSITWRVGDGPVHEIPDGAEVTFHLTSGVKRTAEFDEEGLLNMNTVVRSKRTAKKKCPLCANT